MPTTIRLFDLMPEELRFEARVFSCAQAADGTFRAVLDRTAFFAEGGGQPADTGVLGGARVLDVHEQDGVITHWLDAPLTPGETVQGEVNAAVRLDHSQQHTGEHILSGLTCAAHGCRNVGFHIGKDAVTVDFSAALTGEEIRRLELRANEIVWQDVPVRCWYPEPEELETLTWRSKKELTGAVRIVAIEGADTCACCGTHVPTTGAVGQIRVLHWMNYKGGVRLTIACGGRALLAGQAMQDENQTVSRLLSAPQGALAGAVQRLLAERDSLRAQCHQLAEEAFAAAAERVRGERIRVVSAPGLPPANLRKAAGQLASGAALALVLLPGEDGLAFALSSEALDIRPLARALCTAFSGKGGGPRDMVQGRLACGSEEEIARWIKAEAMGLGQ